MERGMNFKLMIKKDCRKRSDLIFSSLAGAGWWDCELFFIVDNNQHNSWFTHSRALPLARHLLQPLYWLLLYESWNDKKLPGWFTGSQGGRFIFNTSSTITTSTSTTTTPQSDLLSPAQPSPSLHDLQPFNYIWISTTSTITLATS